MNKLYVEPPYFLPIELARILRVNERTIRNRISTGNLLGERYGGVWRIPAREVKRELGMPDDQPLSQEVLMWALGEMVG